MMSKESLQLLHEALHDNLAESYITVNSPVDLSLQDRSKIIKHVISELPKLGDSEINVWLDHWIDHRRRWKMVAYKYERSARMVRFFVYVVSLT